MTSARNRGPRALGDILAELYTLRGYGRLRASLELEEAWNKVVGEGAQEHTRVGQVRRGVLNVTVAHPALLQELAAFRKPELLVALQGLLPHMRIHDIRFRVGSIEDRRNQTMSSESAQDSSPHGMEPEPARGEQRLSEQKKHSRRGRREA